MSDVTVVGMQALGANLDKLFKDSAKKAIRKAATAGAKVFQKEIALRAPVREKDYPKGSNKRLPGFLKKNIGRSSKANSDGSLSVFVGPRKSAFYGRMVEQGHGNPNNKKQSLWQRFVNADKATRGKWSEWQIGNHPEVGSSGTPAHPFIRPAFESKKKEAEEVFSQVAMAEIVKEIK
jgi:HK97 gp10 family phage protein